ncbi:hypothetical protein K440DRAFT_130864 [Wilcoxina mikolae CBS 423.85]|nr:hypothetical protein K440DRAFT_130864 [Wilcoxina mikolae CBS 423.85]
MEDKHLNIQPPEHSSNLPTVAGRIPLSGCVENMEDSNERRVKAAVEIQRFYRAHRERRQLNGVSLTPDERWSETLAEARRRKLAQSVSPEQQLGDAGKSNGSIGPDGRPRPLGSKGFWKKAIDVAKQVRLSAVSGGLDANF